MPLTVAWFLALCAVLGYAGLAWLDTGPLWYLGPRVRGGLRDIALDQWKGCGEAFLTLRSSRCVWTSGGIHERAFAHSRER